MSDNIQFCATIPASVVSDIKEFAQKESRSDSQMASILLQQAIKERKRKRKNDKEE